MILGLWFGNPVKYEAKQRRLQAEREAEAQRQEQERLDEEARQKRAVDSGVVRLFYAVASTTNRIMGVLGNIQVDRDGSRMYKNLIYGEDTPATVLIPNLRLRNTDTYELRVKAPEVKPSDYSIRSRGFTADAAQRNRELHQENIMNPIKAAEQAAQANIDSLVSAMEGLSAESVEQMNAEKKGAKEIYEALRKNLQAIEKEGRIEFQLKPRVLYKKAQNLVTMLSAWEANGHEGAGELKSRLEQTLNSIPAEVTEMKRWQGSIPAGNEALALMVQYVTTCYEKPARPAPQ